MDGGKKIIKVRFQDLSIPQNAENITENQSGRRLTSLNGTTDLESLWYKIVAMFLTLQCALFILVAACYALWTYWGRVSRGSKKMKHRDSDWFVGEGSKIALRRETTLSELRRRSDWT